ncbi:hypothetical protein M3Y97_00301000 [Aphelenchoides bicaudatus]|nr:hypothetical protein M3Y97_00301000 [Aphelenchoides bicaudatus]
MNMNTLERLKRKKEDDEKQRLSAVFEQYRNDFEDPKLAHINQSFIRGEVVNAGKPADLPFTPPPSKKPANSDEAKRLAGEVAKRIMLEAQQKKVAMQIQTGSGPTVTAPALNKESLPVNRPPKPGAKKDVQKTKMSNLEMFKQELKQMQEMRQERRGLREQLKERYGNDVETIDRLAPSLDNPYLHGTSEFADDPTTTNLYLANMPDAIELEDLYETFGSYGPLSSAKILHPRGDEQRKVPTLSGFVAFMSRTDAERAMTALSGMMIRGCEIRISWARPLPAIPTVPFFVPDTLKELAMPDSPTGLPFNAKPQPSDLENFLRKYGDLPKLGVPFPDNQDMLEDYKQMQKNSIIRVVVPTERPLLLILHRVIEFIIREGPMFEACVMERERMNPMFRFLFDNNHPTHVYYRWKLYSLMNGEDPAEWRIERFRMFEDGSWWEPPPLSLYDGKMPVQLYHKAYVPRKAKLVSSMRRSGSRSPDEKRKRTSSQNDDDKANRQRGVLLSEDRDFLEDMLRDLKPDKTSIGDAMIWCLDHADCAKEISECLYESLDIPETPLHKKIARFYLINDILGNCGVRIKDVFYYRQYLEEYLEKVFVSLNATLETIESRIKAEQFRQRIMLCFRMWEENTIYSRDVLIRQQNVFLGLIKPSVKEIETDSEEDLDGVPIDDDEDIDGVPLNPAPATLVNLKHSPRKHNHSHQKDLPDTKWNQDTLDNFTSKWDAPETSDSKPAHADRTDSTRSERSDKNGGHNDSLKLVSSAREEERRRLLREVELKIVTYQDDLEADGASNVDKKLAEYRQKLMEKMEKDLENFSEDQTHSSSSKKSSRHSDDRRSSKKHSSSKRSRSRSRERRDKRSRSKERSDRKRRASRSRSRERRDQRRRSRSRERHRS